MNRAAYQQAEFGLISLSNNPRRFGVRQLPVKKTESDIVTEARRALGQFATNIEPEFRFESHDGESKFRADLKGELSNGEYVLVECKAFNDTLSPYAHAIVQAASYADAIKYPVFIGPVHGTALRLSHGSLDNGLGALHLIAGHLNVGFLCVSHGGTSFLLLRGQRLAGADGLHSEFKAHWGYVARHGSKRVRK